MIFLPAKGVARDFSFDGDTLVVSESYICPCTLPERIIKLQPAKHIISGIV